MSLSDPVLSIILMCAIAAIIAAIVLYVIASYDNPRLWSDVEEEQDAMMLLEPPYDREREPGA